MSRTPLVAGNWKMNGNAESIDSLVTELTVELEQLSLTKCAVLVFPSFVYLSQVVQKLSATQVGVGAQDVDQRPEGAVTGGVSAMMVRDTGCAFAIVGHSERRNLFGDSDELVAEKFEQCLAAGLTPIICVGETLEERKQGQTLDVVSRQLTAVTDRVGKKSFEGAMVAYEPVWAIGTGESASPAQAEEVHRELRSVLAQLDVELSEQTRILYGGSVNAENAATLFAEENVDGALVGGASLKATSFAEICRAAEES